MIIELNVNNGNARDNKQVFCRLMLELVSCMAMCMCVCVCFVYLTKVNTFYLRTGCSVDKKWIRNQEFGDTVYECVHRECKHSGQDITLAV